MESSISTTVLMMHINIAWYWSYPSVSAVYPLEYRNHWRYALDSIKT